MSTISSSLSSMSAPEDYSSSPHSSPGRVMVGANNGQYTTTSPHSSPGTSQTKNIIKTFPQIFSIPGGRVSSPSSQCSEAGGQAQYQYPDYNQYYHSYYFSHRQGGGQDYTNPATAGPQGNQ